MRLQSPILFVCLVVLLSLPVMLSAARLRRAERQHTSAHQNLKQIIRDAERILELRTKQQTIAEQKRPDQDVIARVNAVLAEAGIPTDRFGGLRPESDAALPASNQSHAVYRKQSVRVTLNDLSVPQIGEFLRRWSASQPLWVPTRIELNHVRTAENDGRYGITLLLTATYVAQEASS